MQHLCKHILFCCRINIISPVTMMLQAAIRGALLDSAQEERCSITAFGFASKYRLLYPDSGISMDEEIALGDMIWSYNKAEL